jgi:hypothetical protein
VRQAVEGKSQLFTARPEAASSEQSTCAKKRSVGDRDTKALEFREEEVLIEADVVPSDDTHACQVFKHVTSDVCKGGRVQYVRSGNLMNPRRPEVSPRIHESFIFRVASPIS